DAQPDLTGVGLPATPLAPVGAELPDEHPQRLAGPARRAAVAEDAVAEAAPPLAHPLHVLGPGHPVEVLVLQLPGLIRQVPALPRRGDEAQERLHDTFDRRPDFGSRTPVPSTPTHRKSKTGTPQSPHAFFAIRRMTRNASQSLQFAGRSRRKPTRLRPAGGNAKKVRLWRTASTI